MDSRNRHELLNSPLQQLEMHMATTKGPDELHGKEISSLLDMSSNYRDRESIYSFDSVSTSGRLLDRLELEKEDLFENGDEFQLSRAESIVSIQTTGRLLDRLNLDEKSSRVPNRYPNQKASTNTMSDFVQQEQSKESPSINIKNAPLNIIMKNNQSIESFKVNIHNSNNSGTWLSRNLSQSSRSARYDNDIDESIFGEEHSSSMPSKSGSETLARSNSAIRPESVHGDSTRNKRSQSDLLGLSIRNSGDLTPETRTKLALQLRSAGKHREASYQLQIAANMPYNYPKAMYLYAIALRFGQGVKQNDKQSIKWLCKCVLMNTTFQSEAFVERLNFMEPKEILSLTIQNLNDSELLEPSQLYSYYSSLPQEQITKIVSASKKQSDIVANCYNELGTALVRGWATSIKDEATGIKLLSKAGSMGNANSMIQLGEIWSSKTKSHKKDLVKAAAWLRLSELFGTRSIGNSWIYKEKYMVQPKR